MGIKTSDEMQSLLNARGHFSLRAPFLGLEDAQALINILQEPDSCLVVANGLVLWWQVVANTSTEKYSGARISPAASEAAFNLLPGSPWALFGFVVSKQFGSAVYLCYF